MKNKKERIELSYNYNSQITVDHDYGYFSGANLRYREQKGLDGYIPDSKQAQEQKGKKAKEGPYPKDKFRYDEEEDQFICPII